jgi:hypothetical protein
MYCGGGHLGFLIDIKNINFVEILPMIIPALETKLPRNDHWKVLYKFYAFLCRSEIQDGHHRNT